MTYWQDPREVPKKYIIREGEVKPFQKIDKGWGANLIFPETGFGNREICLQLNFIPPGEENMMHVHNNEMIAYFIEGKGCAWVGDQEFEMKKGDAIFIPPHTQHKFKAIGDKPLRWVCVNSRLGSIFPGTEEKTELAADERHLNLTIPKAQILERNEK